MTLPATLIEADALSFASDWIARSKPFLNPVSDHDFARRWCKLCAETHPQGAEQVVDLAVSYGERSAHEALVELIDEKTDRNEPLGAVLGAYSIRLRRLPFRAHNGPARTTMFQEIVFVLLIIELVERFRLKPTRGHLRKHERPSACSIVAQAAANAGLHRGTEDAFRKIWRRMAPRILPGYRLASVEALKILTPHAK